MVEEQSTLPDFLILSYILFFEMLSIDHWM